MNGVPGQIAIPEPIPELWKKFVWPAWVPLEVSLPIEQFWARVDAHGPRAWVEDAHRSGSYPLGAVVTVTDAMGSWPGRASVSVTGRWVHAWRGTGRIILPDGTWTYSYFTGEEVQRWRAALERSGLSQVPDAAGRPDQQGPGGDRSVSLAAGRAVQERNQAPVPAQAAVPCEVCGVLVAPAYVVKTSQHVHKVCAERSGRAAA